MKNISISEIFPSVQGEGIHTGIPMTFIRFAGCNFCEDNPPRPCSYCDTPLSQRLFNGVLMSISDITKQVDKIGLKRICITGGEPLLQRSSLKELLISLFSSGYWVEIETNGSLRPYMWKQINWVVDVKCPASGNSRYNNYKWLGKLYPKDQVKFVVQDKNDFDFALDVLKKYPTRAHILFSPVFGKLDGKELVQWLIDKKLDYRMNVQLHKYISMK